MLNKTCTHSRSERGIALIEMTCALFIFSIGMLGVIHMFHVCMDKTRALDEYLIAMRAIENEVETLRALPFDKLDNLNGAFASESPSLKKLVKAETTTLIEIPGEFPKDLRQVTVTIRWIGDVGRTIEKHVTTLIARNRRNA